MMMKTMYKYLQKKDTETIYKYLQKKLNFATPLFLSPLCSYISL